MAAVSVTTTPVSLNVSAYPDLRETLQTVVVQNLGPDNLYLDYVANPEDLTENNGIRLVADGIWEIRRYDSNRPITMVSEGTSDVRILAFD